MRQPLSLTPIGVVRSPYRQKFGIPRQPGLATQTLQRIEFDEDVVEESALLGLAGVSHIWVIWWFHETLPPSRAATVRPPRMGGDTHLGVFATRSPFRPNPIGLSLCELVEVGKLSLQIRGGDFLDCTPVLDIKPYLPYAESIPSAVCDWAQERPTELVVRVHPKLQEAAARDSSLLATLEMARDVLRFDPRPAHATRKTDSARTYAMQLGSHDVRFCIHAGIAEIVDISEVGSK